MDSKHNRPLEHNYSVPEFYIKSDVKSVIDSSRKSWHTLPEVCSEPWPLVAAGRPFLWWTASLPLWVSPLATRPYLNSAWSRAVFILSNTSNRLTSSSIIPQVLHVPRCTHGAVSISGESHYDLNIHTESTLCQQWVECTVLRKLSRSSSRYWRWYQDPSRR